MDSGHTLHFCLSGLSQAIFLCSSPRPAPEAGAKGSCSVWPGHVPCSSGLLRELAYWSCKRQALGQAGWAHRSPSSRTVRTLGSFSLGLPSHPGFAPRASGRWRGPQRPAAGPGSRLPHLLLWDRLTISMFPALLLVWPQHRQPGARSQSGTISHPTCVLEDLEGSQAPSPFACQHCPMSQSMCSRGLGPEMT